MAALVAKFVGKKILGETVKNKFGKEVSKGRRNIEVPRRLTYPRIHTSNQYQQRGWMESQAQVEGLRGAPRHCLREYLSTMLRS